MGHFKMGDCPDLGVTPAERGKDTLRSRQGRAGMGMQGWRCPSPPAFRAGGAAGEHKTPQLLPSAFAVSSIKNMGQK